MGKKSYGVYLDEDRVDAANRGVVARDYKGKLSAYLDDLLKNALENETPQLAGNANVIVDLAKAFHPTLAPEIAKQLGTKNQARILALFAESLNNALKRDFDPEATFQLWSSEEALVHQIRANPSLREFLTAGLVKPENIHRLSEDADDEKTGDDTVAEKKRAEKLYAEQKATKGDRRGTAKTKGPSVPARAS